MKPDPAWTLDQLERKARAEAGYAVVANIRTGQDEALRAWAEAQGLLVYIGRENRRLGLEQSIFANPYRLLAKHTREQRDAVIDRYARYLSESPHLLALLPALRGRVLGCWCYPERCHGDVLAEAANTSPAGS
jgi:FMN phosphatase YigB (HAD superfamily)